MAVDMKMPILIVDDYKAMLRIVRNLLKQFGFENVDEAANGGEAFNQMKDKQYGLVISDWNMEPMTGIQLLQQVRADANTKDTPFIIIAAESKAENVIAAKEAGVSNYIVKPFNAKTLKQKLTAVLGAF
ncbi:MAG: two-component system response regulator [Rhodospirillaceae bacterium]|nr:two-component system response regulator [Rhodospirillaceae bacterium]OUX30638.1 MAG: two-component system response regulator [Rhodospirillaceae bacterium TMED256]